MANKPLKSIKFPGLSDTYTIDGRLSEEAKAALLACFRHVAWVDEHGQDYYDVLESALYANQYPKITATFDSGTHSIYNVYNLDDLKQYLTVRYYEDAQDDGDVISSANYSLSGILNVGNSAINVSYNNLTTVFSVHVLDYYNKYSWNSSSDSDVMAFANGLFDAYKYNSDVYNTVKFNPSNATTRRCLVGLFGESPLLASDGTSDTDWYGIPIPEDATQLTVTSDSDIDIAVQWKKYTGEVHIYGWVGDSGWQSGTTYTASIPTHETRGRANYVWINVKKSDGSAFSVNPTISLLFE